MEIVNNNHLYPYTKQEKLNEYINKCKELEELIQWSRINFGVKPCKTEYSECSNIKIPLPKEYLCDF